ncbi:MAG: DUF4846 domain-containing protein, partial [Candidatus Aminicenantes bacterium]|nr:DUF4846 domain-containing protein [Candidatus Aminicenantes bacterium]
MKIHRKIFSGFIAIAFFTIPGFCHSPRYLWLNQYQINQCITRRIPVPEGYQRIQIETGSFAAWLRHLPLKKGEPPVYLYNGNKKNNQYAHFTVVDMDVGTGDLQQCADAIIRLRAEYLYSTNRFQSIRFRFTSGHLAEFWKWIDGFRPRVNGNSVCWMKSSVFDRSYENFRQYLNTVFMYAGSHSLENELHRVREITDIKIGDIFIQGGFPGHAVIVLDMAVHQQNGQKIFLLGQSFMPAQEFHVLKNLENSKINPWYSLPFGEILRTPEWDFYQGDLRR